MILPRMAFCNPEAASTKAVNYPTPQYNCTPHDGLMAWACLIRHLYVWRKRDCNAPRFRNLLVYSVGYYVELRLPANVTLERPWCFGVTTLYILVVSVTFILVCPISMAAALWTLIRKTHPLNLGACVLCILSMLCCSFFDFAAICMILNVFAWFHLGWPFAILRRCPRRR